MTSKWGLSTLIRCFKPLQGETQQAHQADTQTSIALLCARIEALEHEVAQLRDEIRASRERESKLLDVVSRGLLERPKAKRRKGKKKDR